MLDQCPEADPRAGPCADAAPIFPAQAPRPQTVPAQALGRRDEALGAAWGSAPKVAGPASDQRPAGAGSRGPARADEACGTEESEDPRGPAAPDPASAHAHVGEGQQAVPSCDRIYAALDLGTNNCRLLIARPTARNFRVVDAFSRIVRLGEGLSGSGRLGAPAMGRAIAALEVCAGKIAARGVSRARIIATEACRAAENGADFCAEVERRTGLVLEVVDRRTEAGLAASGCAPLVDPSCDGAILFDIGGGSTEVVWLGRRAAGDDGPPRARIRSWASMPVGVVSLAERHGGVKVSRALFIKMVDEVLDMLEGVRQSWGVRPPGRIHLLGTSGTVTTVAGIHLGLERYDRARVDGAWLHARDINEVVDRLVDMSFEERVSNPCIGAQRADLVLAGCAIMEAVREAFPTDRLRVADRGLREGMLVQLMRADGAWRRHRSQ
ncbi:Ppx/GppA phosphatase family protein [Roseixanthobacter liquoris]|uniref:Ppx/GppA phosphatase family protein n=1 Tax=Roseixanthobacter liquoris TaxID=3119921 RepID=UPI0037274F42